MKVNDRVKVINKEIYGTIIYDYGKEVVIIDEDAETIDDTLYFKKSELKEVQRWIRNIKYIKELSTRIEESI